MYLFSLINKGDYMSHEQKRLERLNTLIEIVRKAGIVRVEVLASILSAETGCSMQRSNEYIRTLVLSNKLVMNNSLVELAQNVSTS